MSRRSRITKFIIKIAQVVGFIAVPLLLIAIIIFIPEYQANIIDQTENYTMERARQVNEYRKTAVQLVGGIVIAIGLYLTWRRTKVTEQGHITDRFSKAIEQLGDDKIAVRLGGIFALERIAKDSKHDHWTVMEVLSAFVRNYKPEGLEEMIIEKKELPKIPADVQAAVTVIGRRDVKKDKKGDSLNLSGSYLVGVNLNYAHLEGAELNYAHLEDAKLHYAHLEGALLHYAHLEGANLNVAHLEDANLNFAHLEDASLNFAHLEGAYLNYAHLEGAYLNYAHLEGADLHSAHLEGALLHYAHLEGAELNYAHLEDAKLHSAHLEGALLHYAHLTDVEGINIDQLKSVKSLYKTKGIPEEWEAQLKKEKPCLFTKKGCE